MGQSSADIQNQINAIEEQIQAGAPQGQIDRLNDQITGLKAQLSAAIAEEAKRQNEQAQAAQIGGLKETMSAIFEAIFPKDETVKLIGLTEYEEKQQTYNQLTDQAIDEDQSALYDAFKTQIEQRDERFRALTAQSLEVQNQLDKANGTIQTQAETIAEHEKTIDELHTAATIYQDAIKQKEVEIESREQQLGNAKETIFNLQKQINNVPAAPQIIDITPTKPSESLADKIAQAKVASIKQFSNLYSEVTYVGGTKEVVHNSMLPTLEIPVLPTPEPVDSKNVEQSAPPEQVTTFPEVQTAAANVAGNTDPAEVVGKAEEALVTRAEHEELKARVTALESGSAKAAA